MQNVGVVRQINLFPVKSMRSISVEKAYFYWYGLDGDRKFAFVHSDEKTGFPWVTARDIPQLLQYQPMFASPEDLLTSSVFVDTPSGRRVALDSQELTDELISIYGKSINLLKLKRGTFDCMPVSLLTQTSINTLQSKLDYSLDIRRFRANIIIDTKTNHGFPEFNWISNMISFGQRTDSAQLFINYPAKRCMVVNLHPESGDSNPSVLKTVTNEANACFSVYASVKKLGTVEVGDNIFLQE